MRFSKLFIFLCLLCVVHAPVHSAISNKTQAIIGGVGAAGCAAAAGYCFYKMKKCNKELRTRKSFPSKKRAHQGRIANYYKYGFWGLTALSVGLGIFTIGNIKSAAAAAGTVGAVAGVALAGGGSGNGTGITGGRGGSGGGLGSSGSSSGLRNAPVWGDAYINQIMAECPEHATGGYVGLTKEIIPKKVISRCLQKARVLKRVYREKHRVITNEHMEKVLVKPGEKYLFVGDMHASVHSLIRSLYFWRAAGYIDENLTLADGVSLCFLGDLADRGAYGVEVWYIALSLYIRNPGRVFVIRGNHEEEGLAESYGFGEEIKQKYGSQSKLLKDFVRFWNMLPSAVFFLDRNGDGIQACHGGVPILACELRVKSIEKRIDRLRRFLKDKACFAQDIPKSMAIGFRWGDCMPGDRIGGGCRGAGECSVGVFAIPIIYEKTGVKALFRGHGHNGYAVSTYKKDSDRRYGLKHGQPVAVKDSPFYAFMSCPEGLGRGVSYPRDGCCNIDGFGLWQIGDRFANSTLTPHEYDVSMKKRHRKLVRAVLINDGDDRVDFVWE